MPPVIVQELMKRDILQPYQMQYHTASGKEHLIFLIPVYHLLKTGDEPYFQRMIRPIIQAQVELLRLLFQEEVGRSRALIKAWGKTGKEIWEALNIAAVISNVPPMLISFRRFSELLTTYAWELGWGELLEDGDTAASVNREVRNMKKAASEAADLLEAALEEARDFYGSLGRTQDRILADYARILIEDYSKEWQSSTPPSFEEWLFRFGRIPTDGYVRRSSIDKKAGRVIALGFTIRSENFEPTGVYFNLKLEDIEMVFKTRILDYKLLGWLPPLRLE